MPTITIKTAFLIIYGCIGLLCYGNKSENNEKVTAQPNQIIWDGDDLVESTYPCSDIYQVHVGTNKRHFVKAPVGAVGFTMWNGMASALRLVDRRIVFSRRYPDGLWQDFPTSLDHEVTNDQVFGIPSTLYESDSSPRFFAFNQMIGFSRQQEASICSWWRQGPDGMLEPEILIPIELDSPVFIPLKLGPSLSTIQILHRYEGLRPFLDYPIRVKGAFIIVSWNAGVLWVIKDGSIYPDKIIKMIPLDADFLSGKTRHRAVMLGIQPMKNGHVLIAMRSTGSIFNNTDFPERGDVKNSDAATGKVNLEELRDEVVWKELDPLEGKAYEPDPYLIENAPRSTIRDSPFSFTFNTTGELVLPGNNSKDTKGPQGMNVPSELDTPVKQH